MDYDEGKIESYLFIFDLADNDKKLLAKFEGFDSVQLWEKAKHEQLEQLKDPNHNITYNLFDNISYQNNSKISTHFSLVEAEKFAEQIIARMESNQGYNPVEYETMLSLWTLKNKSEHFNL